MPESPATPEPLISLEAAAERLDMHPRTVRRLISQGRLPGYRVGDRAIRLRMSDVDKLLEPIPMGAHR